MAKFVKIVGQDHLKFDVYQQHSPNVSLPAIAFRMAQHYDALVSGASFSLVYTIDENEWNGATSVQLVARDLKSF